VSVDGTKKKFKNSGTKEERKKHVKKIQEVLGSVEICAFLGWFRI
jgi:hypothetical protein